MVGEGRPPMARLLWEDITPDVPLGRVRVEPRPTGVLVWLHYRNQQGTTGVVQVWMTAAVLRRIVAAHFAGPFVRIRRPDQV